MVKPNISDFHIPDLIADMWAPLNEEQRTYLSSQFTLQTYKKNEVNPEIDALWDKFRQL